jgi:hypothetical protein
MQKHRLISARKNFGQICRDAPRFIPLPGADEIKTAELLNSEYSCQTSCRQKQKWIAVRLKPRAARGTRIMSALVLQSRTGVGTNCKSAFPGARTQAESVALASVKFGWFYNAATLISNRHFDLRSK